MLEYEINQKTKTKEEELLIKDVHFLVLYKDRL